MPSRSATSRVHGWLQRHEFARHFATLLSGTVIAQALPLLVMPVISRLFTETEYGVYTAVLAVVGFLVPVAAFRYDLAIVLPESDDDARRLVRLSTWFNTGTCLVATAVLAVLGRPLAHVLDAPAAAGWFYAAGAIAWLMAELVILSYWLTRTKNYRLISLNRIHQSVTFSSFQLVAGFFKLGVGGLVIAAVLGRIASLVNLLRRAGRELSLVGSAAPDRSLLRRYRKMPLLNGPNALVDSIRTNAFPLLIGTLWTKGALGQFGMAWQLLMAPMALINGAITQIFFQRLSVVGPGGMFPLVRRTTIQSTALGVVAFGALYFLAPPILPWFLGAKWALAGRIAAVLCPWLCLMFITSPISNVFVVTQRQGLMLAHAVVFTVVPLWVTWRLGRDGQGTEESLLGMLAAVSWLSAAMLVVFAALAWYAARQYDRGERPVDTEPVPAGGRDVDADLDRRG